MYTKVKKFGGPLSYSHPIPPSIIGAGMAVTDILLSEEINTIQKELADRINYCNQLLSNSGMPILSHPKSPIKFVGIGNLDTGLKFNKKVLDEGYYINIALFPTVSFIEVLKFHYFNTLQEANTDIQTVHKFFKLPINKGKVLSPIT